MGLWHWHRVLSDNKTWGKLEFDLRWLYSGHDNGWRNFLEGPPWQRPNATQDGDGGKTGKCNYWQWADCDWQWPRSGLVTSHHRFPACDREVSWTCHAWQLVMGLCNTLIDSFRLPTVNIYWWHSHEFLIPSDPVSSNSVLRSQCTRCFLQSSSFCPGAAKNRPSLLIVHLVIAKQKYGSVFTQIRYTTRHSAIVNGLPSTFLVLLKPETWWLLNAKLFKELYI